MAKIPRQSPGGYIYHVLNRANAGIQLFRRPEDYIAFEAILAEGLARIPMRLIAYCVMPNHWHPLLQPQSDGDLSRFMHWATMTHTQRWKVIHQSAGTGHLYQGRFKSFPVQGQYYYLTVLRYIEGNPLRAGLVRSSREWLWSSMALRRGVAKGKLALWPGPVDLPADWADTVDARTKVNEHARLDQSIRRGVPFGDDVWTRQTAIAMGIPIEPRPRSRPTHEATNK